ncbi:hypothetical protein HKX48_006091 [Thoreauomyces humboldtii]|nr:hypothetical protein HKX48_006091 [Thoreauomyces humboldtii]
MSQQQMYVRIKHHKATHFIECTTTSTVSFLKQRFLAQTTPPPNATAAPDVRLHIPGKSPGTWAALDDAAVLEQVGVVNDSVLGAAFWGGGDGGTGSWEPVEVPDFEPLQDELDEATGGMGAEDAKGKGKATA